MAIGEAIGAGKTGFVVLAAYIMVVFTGTLSAQPAPVDWPLLSFNLSTTSAFTKPVVITHTGDGSGRIFVVQQPGQIQILQNGNVFAQPLMDISSRVLSKGAEQGLLGLAFPPGFSTNQHFYVDYTRQPDGAIVISRFFLTSTNSNVADTNSEQVVMVIPKPNPPTTYNNHNAGQIAFGPDGYLYIGVGDGGSEGDPFNNGQKTNNFFGRILRIDVESGASPYAIPTSNPFVNSNGYLPEIWAYGLRNPWRFSFDRQTGDLYIGDVGQNLYEEVDFQPAGSAGGQNYGWKIMEGFSNYSVPSGFTNFVALTPPVTAYSHLSLPTDAAGAVIGGYVYRGAGSARMTGMYFYGDFVAGWIWGLERAGTNWQTQALVNPSFGSLMTTNISTFGEDDQGNLYFADYGRGKIYQIDDSLNVWKPTFSPTNSIVSSNTVSVNCLTPNADIHYTTNGLDPTLSDPIVLAGGTIQVTTGQTNKLRAFRSDLGPSLVAQAIFTNKVATPGFSPAPGAVTNGTLVRIATITPGATIYYTTNETTPTGGSTIYSSPLVVYGSLTVKAIGVETGYSNSAVASGSFSQAQAAAPVFSPPAGIYTPGVSVITNGTLITMSSATPTSVIYYTLDGSTPTTNSTTYSGPFAINGGTTVNAIAVAPGYINSGVQSMFYQLVQTATPVFNPSSGPITNGTPITISCATPGSIIYYTIDGSTPTTNSQIYSVPVIINGGTTLSAYATAAQHLDGNVLSTFYQLVQTADPVFNPPPGPVAYGTPVSITSTTLGATIYYTLDGSNPTTSSPVYSSPIVITGDTNLSVMAVAASHLNSDIETVSYTLTQVAAPVFNPPVGLLTNGALIFISTTNGSNETIRFTTDGSDPNSSSNAAVYAGPLLFTNPITLVARAYASYFDPSDPQTSYYGLSDLKSTVVTTVAGGTTPGFTNGFGASAQFSGPLSVTIDQSGNLYVTDSGNNVIRKISPAGQVTTYAGTGTAGYLDASITNAQFSGPNGILIDKSGIIYVSDNCNKLREITNGFVSTLVTVNNLCGISGVTEDAAGNLYFGFWASLEKLTPDGTLTSLAGPGNCCPDGWGIAVDPAATPGGYIYAGTGGFVWGISPYGVSSVFAGQGGGYSDGSRLLALFENPPGIALDSATNIYVADGTLVRQIVTNWVETLAGTSVSGYQNGRGSVAQFSNATGLCLDTNGNIYVADYGNNCIREISPDTYGIGIPDWWQLAHFGHIGIDPNGDPDHDGVSNFAEFWAGTDPNDSSSVFKIVNASVNGNGTEISWNSVLGKNYLVQYSTDLVFWTAAGSVIPGTGSVVQFTDPAPLSQSGGRYYRVSIADF